VGGLDRLAAGQVGDEGRSSNANQHEEAVVGVGGFEARSFTYIDAIQQRGLGHFHISNRPFNQLIHKQSTF
jgi:hypothetical protein